MGTLKGSLEDPSWGCRPGVLPKTPALGLQAQAWGRSAPASPAGERGQWELATHHPDPCTWPVGMPQCLLNE